MNDEERLICNRFLEAANNCYNRSIPVNTDFLDLNEQTLFQSIIKSMPPVSYKAVGGIDLAERRIIQFLPYEDFPCDTPYAIIRIRPANARFAQELTHRDYLGAILNLGIAREKTGDILITDDCAYLFCMPQIAGFIVDNLVKIKNTVVVASITAQEEFDYTPKFQEITGSVASVRLDAVISVGFSGSRSHLISYIEDGKVAVNGRIITSNGYNLKENDIISVRGLGKIRYISEIAQTHKGRKMVRILKYI